MIKYLRQPLNLVGLSLMVIASVDFIERGFRQEQQDLMLFGLAVTCLIIDRVGNVSAFGIKAEMRGLKDQISGTDESLKNLRTQINTLGYTAVLREVSILNRLGIDHPNLARTWPIFKEFSDSEIMQCCYIYILLDTFELMTQLVKGEPLTQEYYQNWKDTWLPELLRSDIGHKMKVEGLFKFYSSDTQEAIETAAKRAAL